jgi:hypothetical protein
MSDTTKADITNVAESARQLLRVISIRLAFLKAGEVHGRVVVPDVARRRTKYPFTRMPDMTGKSDDRQFNPVSVWSLGEGLRILDAHQIDGQWLIAAMAMGSGACPD